MHLHRTYSPDPIATNPTLIKLKNDCLELLIDSASQNFFIIGIYMGAELIVTSGNSKGLL